MFFVWWVFFFLGVGGGGKCCLFFKGRGEVLNPPYLISRHNGSVVVFEVFLIL